MSAVPPSTPIRPRHLPDAEAVQFINPPGLYDPAPNGYTHAVSVELAAVRRLVVLAGQGGEDEHGQLPDSFDAQVDQAMHNLRRALEAAGAGVDDVVKLTVLIVDHNHDKLAVLGRHVQALWPQRPAPACTLIPVPRLALDGMLFEIEATALVA